MENSSGKRTAVVSQLILHSTCKARISSRHFEAKQPEATAWVPDQSPDRASCAIDFEFERNATMLGGIREAIRFAVHWAIVPQSPILSDSSGRGRIGKCLRAEFSFTEALQAGCWFWASCRLSEFFWAFCST